MDADQRLIALKRAYADIILNTSKEAAARVVASEKKAVRLQKELNDSKEQALQMLLRLKKMMDCKVMEAEMANFNQQRIIQELSGQLRDAADTICKAEATSTIQNKKIEELEAQLNEAEDIVKDLREELKEATTTLEKARENKPESNEAFVTPILEENTQETSPSQPDVSSHLPIPLKKNVTSSRKAFIPSILLKSKGGDFFGNRRTQRIRAFEEKLMAGELDTSYEREGDTCQVEKKVPKFGKFRKVKKKISSTKDLYNRSKKIEDSREEVDASDEKLIENEKKIPSTKDLYNRLKKIEVSHNASDEKSIKNEKASNEEAAPVTNEEVTPSVDREIGDHAVIERFFKYTFQRKRKRESLKESIVERPNCPQEEKCGSIVESSRDSRRLALVAHQLISLSEKKW